MAMPFPAVSSSAVVQRAQRLRNLSARRTSEVRHPADLHGCKRCSAHALAHHSPLVTLSSLLAARFALRIARSTGLQEMPHESHPRGPADHVFCICDWLGGK